MPADALESEPFCTYVPPAYAKLVEEGRAEPVVEYFRRRFAPVAPELLLVR